MNTYGKAGLPTLNLKGHKKLDSGRVRDSAQLPPAGQRRGFGFSGIASDAVPQTSRTNGQVVNPARQPLMARPPVNKKDKSSKPNPMRQPLTARPPANPQETSSSFRTQKHSDVAGADRLPPRRRGDEGRGENRAPREDNPVGVKEGEHPMTPAQALKKHCGTLTGYEQGEILDYAKVWFMGSANAKKINAKKSSQYNNGYDDERGDYHVVMNDHLAYRFEVLSQLGKGSFGQVCKCYDYQKKQISAVKLIRNKKRFHHQALVEVKLLQYIKDRDPQDQANIVHMSEYFYFRNHLCIAFEPLSINLYELIKNNDYQGLSLGLIRRFAVQMLTSLHALKKLRIIHCDLKPENVLLRQPNKSGIKIIDFGSSCFEDERVYTYIQSRFYRSPEVILGLPYDTAIDMWSFGCILAELFTGYPIFPGENEMEQLGCIMEIFDQPPKELVDASNRKKMFFDSEGRARIVPNSRGKKRRPATKSLAKALACNDKNFVNFIEGCLRWDPRVRFTPEDAIQHEWVMEGLQAAQPQTSRASGRSSNRSASSNGSAVPHEPTTARHRKLHRIKAT